MSRTVILHYHLFKNAGTSLDQVLKQNFGTRWVTREFEARANAATHAQEVAQWIKANPDAVAFSSHTMELPPPEMPGVKIVPLIFVRHPIDRVASAYSFERKQGGKGFGSVLARHTTLGGYCEVRLSMPRDRQCRNFQASRFSRMFAHEQGSELERSLKAVRTLPFVGVVEDFDVSMDKLAALLQLDFPDFRGAQVAANVSRGVSRSLAQRVSELQAELGDEVYDQLIAANTDDLLLHQAATERGRRGVAAAAAEGGPEAVDEAPAAPVPASDESQAGRA
ncbi:sulfotransferase family protein [Ideonella azotifigens]|uniref:Sulfotransferase family 2 domain-containing protein n=1 Tax=Ideonella azotifigens TaxID=513160 RepID=A0ABP3USQ2_9BURK|nr:sulfotransferase family 2 domain-containing protein [Ideonella azotifigens]MCD2339635.1 sulfotransferase family protein [Ideonella azotifigens]